MTMIPTITNGQNLAPPPCRFQRETGLHNRRAIEAGTVPCLLVLIENCTERALLSLAPHHQRLLTLHV